MTSHNLPPRGKLPSSQESVLGELRRTILDPQVPIVTLVGEAGVGKTAVALEAAHQLLDTGSLPGGIVWLECSHTSTLDALIEVMRATFALPQSSSVGQNVMAYLRSRRCLLIFDAYDTMAQDMGLLAFLDQLPRPSKALVTSRERVGLLALERVFRIELVQNQATFLGMTRCASR